MKEESLLATTADSPDLGWSQVNETVLMLQLAVSYLQRGMLEGDESINTLTESFTKMMEGTASISSAIKSVDDEQVKDTVLSQCKDIDVMMQSAIMAFQFYDKLTQRLGHVSSSMSSLSELVSNPQRLHSPPEWVRLQADIKDNFTIPEDRQIFDRLLDGMSIDEALAYVEKNNQQKAADDIELF